MENRTKIRYLTLLLPGLFTFIFITESCTDRAKESASSHTVLYQYDESKDLVTFVNEAAKLYSQKGKRAFPGFARQGSRWFKENRYIFIYDLDGVCHFHPITPELVGRNIMSLKDLNGKPVIMYITEIAADTAHPQGWVHYLWSETQEIKPLWKSSYIVRVEDPDGNVYALGSGIYEKKIEKVFVSDLVDSACALIGREGEQAFAKLSDKAGKFYYYDTYIFVMSDDGTAFVDPSFPGLDGRNLLEITDAVGKPIVREMIDRLLHQDTAWIMYIAKKTNESRPSKALTYVRKIKRNGKTYIVGSSLFLEKPVWMRV